MEPQSSLPPSSRCPLHGRCLTVIEFYSGIGGVSYAFRSLGLKQEANITSFDINDVANCVHAFNFPGKTILTRNLTGITASELDQYAADVWTMSPPCQPFTRLGLQKDLNDNRTDSFLHLMRSVLPAMKLKPSFILIENVKGFETSQTRTIITQILKELKYHFREFLLSPSQIGIPNSRLRYYLIARLSHEFPFGTDGVVVESIPRIHRRVQCPDCNLTSESEHVVPNSGDHGVQWSKLQSYLCEEADSRFMLSEQNLRYTQGFDIVSRNSSSTCCFTRGYGHLLLGSGSVLQTNEKLDPHQLILQIHGLGDSERIARLKELGLRFFTPQEVANLMCFPAEFHFPHHITDKQRFRLLGNSVNVRVIVLMLQLLFLA